MSHRNSSHSTMNRPHPQLAKVAKTQDFIRKKPGRNTDADASKRNNNQHALRENRDYFNFFSTNPIAVGCQPVYCLYRQKFFRYFISLKKAVMKQVASETVVREADDSVSKAVASDLDKTEPTGEEAKRILDENSRRVYRDGSN